MKKARKKQFNKQNILIAALLAVIATMTVGYAALATTLNINGTARIAGDWDVEIIGIESAATGTGADNTEPTYTATTATFDAKLMKPGDAMTYTITVKNKGNIDASLSSITLAPQATGGAEEIEYTVVSAPSADDVLAAGAQTTVVVKSTYVASSSAIPSENKTKTFTGVLNYVQAD